MAKFGHRMSLDALAKSQYGARARTLKEQAERDFAAQGHKPTPWEMDREIGVYFLTCATCKRSARLSMREDNVAGLALTYKCNDKPWLG